jgi:hypothetical protein
MILATEAAKLAAQLGIPTAELAMSPATIPLLSSILSDVPNLPAPVTAPKPNQTLQSNNRAAKGGSTSAFRSLASFRQQSTQRPEQLSMVPHQAFGPAFGAARLPLPIAPPFTVPTFPLMMPAWNASMTPMQGAQALALASMGNRPTSNRGIQNNAASVATRSKLQ